MFDIRRKIFSVPIYFKILGIGIVTALLFGTATYLQLYYQLHGILEQLGKDHVLIARETNALTYALMITLGLCFLVGLGLTSLLTFLITRPISDLVQATQRLSSGDFDSRVRVFFRDEIGLLAESFNQMAGKLQEYYRKIREEEAKRISNIKTIVSSQENDRKLVARELHDQLGQSLSAFLLRFQSLTIQNGIPETVRKDLAQDIKDIMEDVRRLAWDLRPSILDDYGLEPALGRYVEEAAKHAQLSIDYQSNFQEGSSRLPDYIEINLYRIAQEAILNAVSHARAGHISVVLLLSTKEVLLLVEDDGVGFDLKSVHSGQEIPLGLIGMRERTSLLSGHLQMESTPSQGTMVQVRIPLGEKKQETQEEQNDHANTSLHHR